MTRQLTVATGLGLTCLIALVSCGGNTSTPADNLRLYAESISRMHQLAQGATLYLGDYDEVLPRPNSWMDVLIPYVHDESLFSSPILNSRAPKYGYAFNSEIAGHGYLEFPAATTIMLFDSTVLARNATASISTMPVPPRYGESNTIAYLDGHVKDETIVLPPPDLAKLAESRLKQISVGMLIYSSDYDDNLPPGDQWIDRLTPYVKAESTFHSPAFTDPGVYGFAYDQNAAGMPTTFFDFPAQATLDFDSTVLTKSAVAHPSTLPVPARYQGGNFVGYVDGHVKQVN